MPTRPSGDGQLSEAAPPLSPAPLPAPTDPAPAAAPLSLEFALPPGEWSRLLRAPAVARRRLGRCRRTPVEVIWHDGPGGELAERGLALAEQRGRWRLERLRPSAATDWPPAGATPVLHEASSPAGLPEAMPERLVPVAAFSGEARRLALSDPAGETRITLIEGAIRGLATETPAARLRLEGEAASLVPLAREVAAALPLGIPGAGLAAEAAATARGERAAPRHLGAPKIPPGVTVAEAFDTVLIHLVDVTLHWSRRIPGATGPEPVHQMRVALRRLRSALALFRPAADSPELRSVNHRLRSLARLLGAARDWDVFGSGIGTELGARFAEEPAAGRMLARAERQRLDAYAAVRAFLAGADWRELALDLALLPSLRPWRDTPDAAERLEVPIEGFAAKALGRRHRQVAAAGPDLLSLSPEARHELRKQAKRLRYAAEFLAPLFPGKPEKKFLARLAKLQDALGQVNDAEVAGTLIDDLGRGYGAGLLKGYLAAGSSGAVEAAQGRWKKWLKSDCFW